MSDPNKPVIYLATPYSNYHLGRAVAFIHACQATGHFIRLGHAVYSPIAHTHAVIVHTNFDLPHSEWLAYDIAMLSVAAELWVVEMSGWKQSKGITFEIETFIEVGKPIRYFSWPDLIERSV